MDRIDHILRHRKNPTQLSLSSSDIASESIYLLNETKAFKMKNFNVSQKNFWMNAVEIHPLGKVKWNMPNCLM